MAGSMRVDALFSASEVANLPAAWRSIEITALGYDARKMVPKGLFAAWRGQSADGHDFIDEARARGAVFVLAERALGAGVPHLVTGDVPRTLALAAARLYEQAVRGLVLVGITGTNGKTTCAHLVASVLAAAFGRAAAIGTLGLTRVTQGSLDIEPLAGGLTTPQGADLYATLARLAGEGFRHVAIEATSIALVQGRLADLAFDVAALTNLTREHLDVHGTMQAYAAAKAQLFAHHLKAEGRAVLNADDAFGQELAGSMPRALLYGSAKARTAGREPQIVLIGAEPGPIQTRCRAATPRGELALSTQLKGDFNVANVLLALAVGEALDLPFASIAAGVWRLGSVPGRLEQVQLEIAADAPLVLVDFAHKPDALRLTLAAAKHLAPRGRLFCVFGCGGDRDVGKRPLMGALAIAAADWSVLTSDNPRSEEPGQVVEAIARGARAAGGLAAASPREKPKAADEPGAFHIEVDRRRAIRVAIDRAAQNDVVVLAGKGHETYQLIGSQRLPFDDRVEARAALAARAERQSETPAPERMW